VFVIVPEGREVPIPATEATAAGGAALRCKPAAKGAAARVYRLPWSTYTRRRVNAGDLVLCDRQGRKVASAASAAAPAELELAPDGTVPPPATSATKEA